MCDVAGLHWSSAIVTSFIFSLYFVPNWRMESLRLVVRVLNIASLERRDVFN